MCIRDSDVTVPPKPKGFPMATTQSPTRALSEFPNFTGFKSSSASTLSTAISANGSEPRTFALNSYQILLQ